MTTTDPKTIVSLFDYSGRWCLPYKEAGYDTFQIDIKLGLDILDLSPEDFPDNVYGILAAPPCTDFSGSGAQYWKQKDEDGRTTASLRLIDKTIELIQCLDPVFWALENPVGRLPKLRPWIGKPWYFNPCDFAGYIEDSDSEAYTKKTGIWGKFNKPIPKPVEPIHGSKMWTMYGGKSEKTKEARSITPLGFAKAFFEVNK